MAIAFVPMLILVNSTPDRIPADEVLEGIEAQEKTLGEVQHEAVEPKSG